MVIEYTGRQMVVTQKYKDLTAAGLKRVKKIVGEGASAKVILTVDKHRKIADVTVSVGSQSMVSNCESAEMTTALRDALAKLEQMAIRQKQKISTIKRHPRTGEMTAADVEVLGTFATAEEGCLIATNSRLVD
jgi:ribosomal subunit interface protein